MSTNYTLKDFTLQSLRTNAIDRTIQFKKWLNQAKENNHQIFWTKAYGAVKPVMTIEDPSTGLKREVISFVSNDYLGMSQRPETIQAGIEALKKYGTGACAAPSIGGYLDIHQELEKEIADFTGQEDALVFSSGFGVNVGVLNALLGKEDIAFIDSQVHSSILDGLRETNTKNIGHNNVEYLEFALQNERQKHKTAMVIIDGIYSQDGDAAPLTDIVALCKKYNALLCMDDAHGVGVFGKNGRGVAEHFNLLGQVDIITGTFSKAFGAVGGFAACSKDMADYLRLHANTTVFSSSLTPQVACSVLKALELIKTDKSILQKLWNNVDYFRKRLQEEGFDTKQSVAAIFPIMVRDPFKTYELARLLKERYNIYTMSIVYPAVVNKDSRIRVSLIASHEKEHLDALITALCEIDKELHIR
jgi:glycine C-acetyltransferase